MPRSCIVQVMLESAVVDSTRDCPRDSLFKTDFFCHWLSGSCLRSNLVSFFMESDVREPSKLVDSDNEPSPPSPTPLSDGGTEQPAQLDLATQARLEALLEAAGIVSSTQEARRALADPEILRRLTTSVSSALDEAAATLSRIRAENDTRPASTRSSLAEACANGDYAAVSRFLNDRKGLQDLTQEESDSLLSLACSAGYFELAQVLVSMRTAKEGEGGNGVGSHCLIRVCGCCVWRNSMKILFTIT
jgi:ankyrin repeat domain-containing protein 17